MAYRYTREQKAQVMILLAANRGNVNLTSSQTGISADKVRDWATAESTMPSPDMGRAMEMAIQHIMGQIPNLVNKYNVADLLGVLLDKWLQYKGIPQNSTQTILAILSTKSESQLDRMIEDIDQGRNLIINAKQQVSDLEREMANVGLIGLADRGVENTGSPVLPQAKDVTDLIEYTDYGDDD